MKKLIAVGIIVTFAGYAAAQGPHANPRAQVRAAVHFDTSPPLRDIVPELPLFRAPHEAPRPLPFHAAGLARDAADPVAQTSASVLVAATTGLGFAGVGEGDYGFSPDAAPPDTNGAVGATQYVQWVNESFAVFDKTTGALVYGPAAGNTLWSGFGGGCENNNDGDPIAQYDKMNNRWIMSQFSVSTTPYLQCFAVSATSDARGSWHRYAFQQPSFPDYPKIGVWPDGYYASYNMFTSTFQGGRACAYDAGAMRSGAPATEVCFQLTSAYGGLLPADIDTPASLPADGSPEYFLNFGSSSLHVWKLHADFVNTANSTFTGPTTLAVAAFSSACNGGACIPQPGKRSAKLDSLADRLMYRLAYSNVSGQESLVVNHSVKASSSRKSETDGIRWYEIDVTGGTPSIRQQGTFAPDGNNRWMGSAARDKAGNIAIGYSVSSSSVYPSVRYTGRLANDPVNTLAAEASIRGGTGAQGRTLNRWGDYSSLSVDPADGCTMWYTTEYLKADGTFNWSTWIGTIRFSNCN